MLYLLVVSRANCIALELKYWITNFFAEFEKKFRVKRERTSAEIVMYALFLYFLGLSFRIHLELHSHLQEDLR
jgi:hypothetical protein